MGVFSKKEYKGTLIWENLKNEGGSENSYRTKIHGGWLVMVSSDTGMGGSTPGATFVPDPEHKWDGNSKR